MQFWVGVENFAKIESAKICVDHYTLLVGQNNSGKTFLMQLVQGLSKKLVNLIDDDIEINLKKTEQNNVISYEMNSENISGVVQYLNKKLDLEKENIVYEIFGKRIPIEKLYIDMVLEEDSAYEMFVLTKNNDTKLDYIFKTDEQTHLIEHIYKAMKNLSGRCTSFVVNKISEKKSRPSRSLLSCSIMYADEIQNSTSYLFEQIFDKKSLFFPASRTGLLLLYREFFANKTDNKISYIIKDGKMVEKEDSYAGFTQPMYEFLRFLQTYSEEESFKNFYKDELNFFECHVIDGRININKQGAITYNSSTEQESVPMYLASSMINEVAPLALALTSEKNYTRLIIDEVEASLHPEKQLELVRFFNRLNNKNMSLIISTHSDTFVSKLNNLYILSKYIENTNDYAKLEPLGLEKSDLLNTNSLFVYEFVNQSNGKSVVKEVYSDEQMGYQFDLFTKSALKLYDEAVKLGEIL